MRIGLTGEAEAQAGDKTLRLVMNNAAWIAAERVLGRNFQLIILEMASAEAANEPAQLGTTSAVLYGATRLHHAGLTFDDCTTLLIDYPEINLPLGEAMAGSIKLERREPEPGEAMPGEAPAPEAGNGTKP